MVDDVGEMDLCRDVSLVGWLGELRESIDGADGGDVEAGTEARYSAPALGMLLTLPTRFLLLRRVCVGDRVPLRSSSVRVRWRGAVPYVPSSQMLVFDGRRAVPFLVEPVLLDVRASIPVSPEPFCADGKLLDSRSFCNLRLCFEDRTPGTEGPVRAAGPPTMVVVVVPSIG